MDIKFIRLLVVTGILASFSYAFGQSGPSRVDFDDRLIKGQTRQANSIYIFERQTAKIKSLVNRKRTFRYKSIRIIFED